MRRYDDPSAEEKQRFTCIAPDFVIEVRSSSDSFRRFKAEMDKYTENGVRLGFLIDPFKEKAWVYEPGKDVIEVPGFSQKLSGGEVLPEFDLDSGVFV